MSPRVLFLLLLPAACAGPSAHQTPSAPEPETVRLAVATTLVPDDPLGAPHCGLPTAPNAQCNEAAPEPEKKKEEGHQHHQHGGAAPQPEKSPEVPHQHGGTTTPEPARPQPAAAAMKKPQEAPATEATVTDPVCKMKIDPKTAKGGTLKANGTQYWFCSSSCRRTFLSQNPGAK